jgi:hypothetical protein
VPPLPHSIPDLKRAFAKFNRENDICVMCMGTGCRPEAFGVGNPIKDKTCLKCKGRGFIKKQGA